MQHWILATLTCFVLICFVLIGVDPAYGHGSLHERLKRADKKISASPNRSELYLNRARLHREHGDLSKAHHDLDRALSLAPGCLEASVGIADLCMALDVPEIAAAIAWSILQKNPENEGALLVFSRASLSARRYEDALHGFDRLIALARRPSPDLYLERLRACQLAHPGDLDLAIDGLERGLARLGTAVALVLTIVELETQAARYDAALRRLAFVESRANRKARWRVQRAEILVRARRVEEAHSCARAALEELAVLRRSKSGARLDLVRRAKQILQRTTNGSQEKQ